MSTFITFTPKVTIEQPLISEALDLLTNIGLSSNSVISVIMTTNKSPKDTGASFVLTNVVDELFKPKSLDRLGNTHQLITILLLDMLVTRDNRFMSPPKFCHMVMTNDVLAEENRDIQLERISDVIQIAQDSIDSDLLVEMCYTLGIELRPTDFSLIDSDMALSFF